MGLSAFAPVPEFRYVGLEPLVRAPRLGAAATAAGLGAGVTLALVTLGGEQAVLAGALASILSALALRSGSEHVAVSGAARMRIVPWGVLIDADETPRILRWAAVRNVEVVTSSTTSRVVVETDRDRFVGSANGPVVLDGLVENVSAYAEEQAAPLALDLDGDVALDDDTTVASCESLLSCAVGWLDSACGAAALDLPPAGYRRSSAHVPTPRAVDRLRAVLRDRTPKRADPRAFAAVLAAELHATELVPDLVRLTQCPHPLVAAVTRQAARKLGASRARTGALDEVAPFLFDGDRERLQAWAR